MNPLTNPKTEPTATSPPAAGPRFGSGAEQDRYASHFGIGSGGLERIKQAASYKGSGAEQDRYESHFHVDQERVKEAAHKILHSNGSGAEQDRWASHFGLGADGWERAKRLAATKGEGAEQVRTWAGTDCRGC